MPVTRLKTRWVDGNLVYYDADGAVYAHMGASSAANVLTKRVRTAIAAVNAGAELLAAIAGFKYRLIDAAMIAIGGNVGAVTTIDVLATQAAGSVKLGAWAQAALTRSTVIRAGEANGAVLVDGASFVANDANTAITIGITGASATVATHIDVLLTYVIEA